MKKIALFTFSILSLLAVKAQTADDIINKFIEAHGGKERLNAITSLQVQSTLNLEQMGMSINITNIKEKNKLFRIQSSSPMSSEESFTVITDTAGYSFTPAMQSPMGSMDATLTKFTKDELKQQAYQKDCAGYFSQLVDYAVKGTTATLAGSEKINGTECDKVKLKLVTGQEMVYYIAQTNGQVKRVQVAAPVAMEMMGLSAMMKSFGGGSRGGDRKIDIDYDKYKIFDGFPFPTKQTIQLGPMSAVVDNVSFKVSQAIDAKWYNAK